jgi:UDP-N-acetylglucosamine 4,6-dehydratase
MSGLSGNILITGGSGTLGHAIVRTAEREGWDCSITIYSRSELRQAQMRAKHPRCRYVLGDVRDADRVRAAIVGHDMVIHAAAMKRLDDCDRLPNECYATNITGSLNVLWACQFHGVRRLIGISTDKACAATTAYGASKLAMEKAFSAAPSELTTCTLVRYGNVVASNGSVVQIWRDRQAQGLPLTLTDPQMTRFWMAPSAAVQLIAYAATLCHSTIAVPKMGALSIGEMASIVAPGAEQQIIGLRFAEKIHEDLVATHERATETPTHYLLGQGHGGYRYTSEIAPRLNCNQFLAMLEEVEHYD